MVRPMKQRTLIKQPTAALTRKQLFSTVASGSMIVVFWLLKEFTGIIPPPEVVATVTGMAAAITGYMTHDAKPDAS